VPDTQEKIPANAVDLTKDLKAKKIRFDVEPDKLLNSLKKIKPVEPPLARLPVDLQLSIPALKPAIKRFHGAKVSLGWFPGPALRSPCANKFGYMSTKKIRDLTKLPFDAATTTLLGQLGTSMADPARTSGPDSAMPAGFTYVGQFIDHDVTLDVSSAIDAPTDATTIHNMRSPSLDLDSMYGRGPALDPFLYAFPSSGPDSAIKMQLGSNTNTGPGGPGGPAGFGGMVVQADWDVPRSAAPSNTALLGDPRNDENLIVSQFHHAMLRFHNKVVDLLLLAPPPGDIFVEAKRITTHHYQWAVLKDYLKRICGTPAVNAAMAGVSAPIGSAFAMPVEFAVAAYRFGHSQIRNNYWVNFNFINASLAQVFEFIRDPRLPVFSNWVVDMNAFFQTGIVVPVNNKAKKIDSVLAPGLNTLPGFPAAMAALATRNLRRGQAMGLPSGQGMAKFFGVTALTEVQLKSGLPASEIAILDAASGLLKKKTPLWYYILREAMVLEAGEKLGPVGGRIVAETFVRMLKRDADSFVNASPAFTPSLPSAAAGDFTFADLVKFAGVTLP
jgi:Animal haem peroxidase